MPLPLSSGLSRPTLNALDSPELSPATGRKRQRSQSMQSDSAASTSSAKRSVADNPSNDNSSRGLRTDHPTTIPVPPDPNQEIDAYMAEQGEEEIPPFTSPPSYQDKDMQPVSREEKFNIVSKGKARQMEIGETWYLVSAVWYKRWSRACTGEVDKEGPVIEAELGPVDNSTLLDTYGHLLPSLAENIDVEYVPEEVWKLFIQWCVERSIFIRTSRLMLIGMVHPRIHCLGGSSLEVSHNVQQSRCNPCA